MLKITVKNKTYRDFLIQLGDEEVNALLARAAVSIRNRNYIDGRSVERYKGAVIPLLRNLGKHVKDNS